ncbi:hypothetical protein [Blastococcus atacamensis]|uniref:hypothetical protein n=1 Tax=Blastococcus atacamensis TaxID=2070508 RepID=UPI0012FFE683|nr:hypothetical protein [Blastococcus atacamensis]
MAFPGWMSDVVGWLGAWVQSPGFGGVAAVIAAIIAFKAATRAATAARTTAAQDRLQRERAERKAQWWLRAQWALDLTLSSDSETRTVGFRVLEALADSEWAEEHEGDIIAAATERALIEGSDTGPQPQSARTWRQRLTPRGGREDG